MHYPGYQVSRQKVEQFTRQECIDLIESLFGWAWGEDGIHEDNQDEYSLDRLREEALRQHDEEWTVPTKYIGFYPDRED